MRGLHALLRALAAAVAVAALCAPPALADGDPASDVLPTKDVYFPLSAPSGSVAASLTSAVAHVYAGGDRVKVAVIASRVDLGAIPSLFNLPGPYARFLGQELAGFYSGPLLIVMPAGYGIYDGARSTAAAGTILEALGPPGKTPDDLTRSAAAAVQKLQAAGALVSPDTRAPYAYPDYLSVRPGSTARLTFRVLDDGARARVTVTIRAGARTLATLHTGMLSARFDEPHAVRWAVPTTLPARTLRFCLTATDPAGNRAAPVCAPLMVKRA